MKALKTIAYAVGLLAVALPASAAFDLGAARDYNAYVFGGYEAYHGDTQGRLAVGENLRIRNYGIVETEYNHPISNLSDDMLGISLVVGGNASIADSRVHYGSTVIGGNAITNRSGFANNLSIAGTADLNNGSVDNMLMVGGKYYTNAFGYDSFQTTTSAVPVDFAADQTYLSAYSTTLSKNAITGGVTRTDTDNGRYLLNLTGNGTADSQVFNLTADDLANAYDISLLGIGSATSVLINVDGINISMKNMGGGDPDFPDQLKNASTLFQKMNGVDVLFNFYNAQTVDLYNIGIYGTLLATTADIIANEGRLTGLMVANSYNSTKNFQFNVLNITPAPEPSEYLMMGLGLALVGLFARKRMKSQA